MAEQVFHIHSTVRDITTRTQRAANAGTARLKQYLGGGMLRLIRKRPTPVTESVVVKLRAELIAKSARGELKVTLPDGRLIDLETLKPLKGPAPAPPKPAPKLDSAADDKSYEHGVGESKEQLPGGVPADADLDTPAAMKTMPEGEEPPAGPSVMDDDPPPKAKKKVTKKTARKSSRGK
jgi:hypothetical protein